MVRRLLAGAAFLLILVGLVTAQQGRPPVDDKALASVESRPGDWLSYGRDYYEQRFSPLDQINDTNAAKLGLAWSFETATDRGSRYGSCLRRSQYVTSARCRATAPIAVGWPLRRAMRS